MIKMKLLGVDFDVFEMIFEVVEALMMLKIGH